jgi:protoporphyrinogen oxidase
MLYGTRAHPFSLEDVMKNPSKLKPAVKDADTVHATITVHQAPVMTKKGRRSVAQWMRRQADFLEKNGSEFANRFTARYISRN